MAKVPTGVIFIWSGTNSSIPSGWERVTALDGKYPKGTADSVNPNVTGGNATHSHTSSGTHTHTMNAHTHSITLPANTSGDSHNDAEGGNSFATKNHTHNTFTSGAVSNTTIQSVSVTYSAISSDPPYHEVIFITPTSDTSVLPSNVVYLYEGTDSLAGHYVCDGNNSTPDLTDKYLKGATTSGDAGGTGGSTTNIHNIDHSHTQSHQHAAVTSGSTVAPYGSGTSPHETAVVNKNHTHSVSLSANTTSTGTTSIPLTTAETVEPAYTKLLAVQNQTANGARIGMIGSWMGTLSSIPNNYVLMDGTDGTDMRGRHLKITATTSEIGNTGGSNTHTHASQSHAHGVIAHTHAIPQQGHTSGTYVGDGSPYRAALVDSYHAAGTSASGNYELSSANTVADTANNEPEYITVAYIQYKGGLEGGAFLFNML